MKSIKEKAKEYDMVVERISANGSIVDVSYREQFEAGANYVLEQISQTLQGDLNSRSAFKLKVIKQIIKQLKK